MSDDLVQRLRDWDRNGYSTAADEAADEIERLRAENEALKANIEAFSAYAPQLNALVAENEALRAKLATVEQAQPVDERQAFDAWCAQNGHGTIDDMLMPLDRSLRALLWTAWQARAAIDAAMQETKR